ncbi:MAG: hypothetical protein AAB391_00935 [Patescibacteria group bacterium]
METSSQPNPEGSQSFTEVERRELKELLLKEEGGFDLIFDHCAAQDPEWMRRTLNTLKKATN